MELCIKYDDRKKKKSHALLKKSWTVPGLSVTLQATILNMHIFQGEGGGERKTMKGGEVVRLMSAIPLPRGGNVQPDSYTEYKTNPAFSGTNSCDSCRSLARYKNGHVTLSLIIILVAPLGSILSTADFRSVP